MKVTDEVQQTINAKIETILGGSLLDSLKNSLQQREKSAERSKKSQDDNEKAPKQTANIMM